MLKSPGIEFITSLLLNCITNSTKHFAFEVFLFGSYFALFFLSQGMCSSCIRIFILAIVPIDIKRISEMNSHKVEHRQIRIF